MLRDESKKDQRNMADIKTIRDDLCKNNEYKDKSQSEHLRNRTHRNI